MGILYKKKERKKDKKERKKERKEERKKEMDARPVSLALDSERSRENKQKSK